MATNCSEITVISNLNEKCVYSSTKSKKQKCLIKNCVALPFGMRCHLRLSSVSEQAVKRGHFASWTSRDSRETSEIQLYLPRLE